MTSRTLVVLAAALAVLALLAVYGQRGDSPSQTDRLLLPDLAAALQDIDRVRVVGAGNETRATLERRAESWVIAEKQGYPADIAKLRTALRSLAEARVVEQKTSNPAYYDRLGVEPIDADGAFGVELTAFAGDAVRAAVIVGDTAGNGLQYLRASDAETSYLVDREIDVPRDAVGWIDPAILDVPGNRIGSVTIEHADGDVVRLTKADADQSSFTVENIPADRELAYAGVANVIGNTLRDLRLDDVAAADGEPPETATRTTFTTFDGLVVTATSYERDDAGWVRFAAGVAAEDASSAAQSGAAGEDGSANAASDESNEAAASTNAGGAASGSGTESAADEAARINARTIGWQFRIPQYQLDQLTRRMEDLLRDANEE